MISSGQYGERFCNMDIQYDQKTKTLHHEERDLQGHLDGRHDGAVRGRPAVKPIVDDAVEVANELGSVVLGQATADFGRAVASNPVQVLRRSPRTAAGSRRWATSWPTCSCGRSTRTAPATWTSPS